MYSSAGKQKPNKQTLWHETDASPREHFAHSILLRKYPTLRRKPQRTKPHGNQKYLTLRRKPQRTKPHGNQYNEEHEPYTYVVDDVNQEPMSRAESARMGPQFGE